MAENVENQTATLSGLLPETEYTVYVVTECDGVESELKSIAKTFTTDVACPAPTNVAFTKITENEATITWSSTENAGSWKVSYKAASDEEWSAEEISGYLESYSENEISLVDENSDETIVLKRSDISIIRLAFV